jgi:hypothetical protein
MRAKLLLALKATWLTTSEISEECDISTRTLNRKLAELQALGICEFMSGKTAGAERDFYDGRSNHYRLASQWVEIVEKYTPAICKGVGTDRNICTNRETDVNPSTNCWSIFSEVQINQLKEKMRSGILQFERDGDNYTEQQLNSLALSAAADVGWLNDFGTEDKPKIMACLNELWRTLKNEEDVRVAIDNITAAVRAAPETRVLHGENLG